ncbi:MAG: GyrI-like domain-containing protein [Firmicutes bacterium]|nr:GyrI-like domain-containing protein [Bacillota bacterium]
MKYEWRKEDKDLYLPKPNPTIIHIPKMQFLTITGEGNPNSEVFSGCVGALYALSYGIKMNLKKRTNVEGYQDYTVFPLEGIWNLNDEGKRLYEIGTKAVDLKDYFTFKVMIRQPNFVSKDFFEEIKQMVFQKQKNDFVLSVVFEEIEEGLVCQMLHQGSYDDEPASFARMESEIAQQGYTRISKEHKEIYLSDPQKVEPSKLKTTLRFKICKS